MVSFLQMQDDIADELLDHGAISRDQIKKAIIRSIAQYERKDFWFAQALVTFSTVVGQEYYTTPAHADIPNMVDVMSIKYNDMVLVGLDNATLESMQEGTSTGDPCYYSFVGGQIRLYPVPSSVGTIRVFETKRLATLSADDDTNAWLTFGEELIRQSAKRRIAMDVLHADDLATRCGLAEKIALDALQEENRRRRPNKFLRVPDGLQTVTASNVMTGY